MSFNHNVTRNVGNDVAFAPVAAGTGDVQNGLIIDSAGWESLVFTIYFGALTSGATPSIQLQYGNQVNGSDMVNIPNAVTNVIQATGSNLGWMSVELYRPTKRYVRATVNRAGANAVINGGWVNMLRAGILPPAQGVTMGNVTPPVLVSP